VGLRHEESWRRNGGAQQAPEAYGTDYQTFIIQSAYTKRKGKPTKDEEEMGSRIEFDRALYHVILRGNAREPIFNY